MWGLVGRAPVGCCCVVGVMFHDLSMPSMTPRAEEQKKLLFNPGRYEADVKSIRR